MKVIFSRHLTKGFVKITSQILFPILFGNLDIESIQPILFIQLINNSFLNLEGYKANFYIHDFYHINLSIK